MFLTFIFIGGEIFMRRLEETYDLLKDNKYFDYFMIKDMVEKRDTSEEREKILPHMKPYVNPFQHILYFKSDFYKQFKTGDEIVVQEKIDGSNTHFNVNQFDVTCYGKNFILNEYNHLQGYWYWVQDNYKRVLPEYQNLDIYGEWLVPHHCEYPAGAYGRFYVFDIMENGIYWRQDRVEEFTEKCGFDYVPILYRGEFISWEHIMSMVGTSKIAPKGEGVVIKNQTTINRPDGRCFYVKIVDKEFQETNEARNIIKTVDMDNIIKLEKERLLTQSIVTLPRVRKILLGLIDTVEINRDWYSYSEDYIKNSVLKILKSAVYKDCVKEENDIVNQIEKVFGAYCGEFTHQHLLTIQKEILEMNK